MTEEARKYLENKGTPKGAPLQRIDHTMKDTYFIDVSTALAEHSLFGKDDSVNKMYKRGSFPLGIQSFTLTHIRIVPYVAFTVPTDALQYNNLMAHFLEDSFLEIKVEGKDSLIYPIHRGVEISPIPLLPEIPAATNAYSIVRQKFNTYDKLADKIEIGPQVDVDVTFKPASGLTTAASSANQDWTWPSADAGFTTDIGFAIMFYLRGYLERMNY